MKDRKRKDDKSKRVDIVTFSRAVSLMLKDIEKGKILYFVLSKKTFYMLIFALAMDIIASALLINLFVGAYFQGGVIIEKPGNIMFLIQLSIFCITTISALWLLFRSNIIAE